MTLAGRRACARNAVTLARSFVGQGERPFRALGRGCGTMRADRVLVGRAVKQAWSALNDVPGAAFLDLDRCDAGQARMVFDWAMERLNDLPAG